MKRKQLCLIASLFSSLVLSSCGIENPFSIRTNQDLPENAYRSGEKKEFKENRTSPFLKGKDYFRKVMTNEGQYAAPSINENGGTLNARMCVIPVVFPSSHSEDLANAENHSKLEKVFFGSAADTQYYESVKSFYEKSSYGKMSLSGEVLPYYTLSQSFSYYKEMADNGKNLASAALSIVDEAYEHYFGGSSPTKNYSDFDGDNDNIIDYFWIVYMDQYNSKDKSGLSWAFTNWKDTNKVMSGYNNYSFASYDFMNDAKVGLDAHTFIHETGHQMGLDDYYSYDEESDYYSIHPEISADNKKRYEYYCPRSPMGKLVMMDNNILDHDAFTKYCLGWSEPEIGKEGESYTLKPFESTGDSLILASDFNGTCFDEYYLVEYYTPTGLNKHDVTYPYIADDGLQGIDAYGLRIYHVDQRLTLSEYSRGQWKIASPVVYYDVPSIPDDNRTMLLTVSSNSRKYCYDSPSQCLVSLVQASGKTNLSTDFITDSRLAYLSHLREMSYDKNDLFTEKSLTFGKDIKGKSSEGWTLPFSLRIDSMNEKETRVTLVPNA